MKYLAIFLIIILISVQSLNVHSTVVHVQSSKGKHLAASKAKLLKKVSKCSLHQEKMIKSVKAIARIGNVEIYKHF